MSIKIVIDDREHKLHPYLAIASEKYHIDYEIKRLTIGDIAILKNDIIIMIIERKTWSDLASSILDGRKNNVEKLMELRSKTNCKISYIIEGDAYPDPSKFVSKYCKVPYKNLISHLDHLIFRDNIHILYAKYEGDTVNKIFSFAFNVLSIKKNGNVLGNNILSNNVSGNNVSGGNVSNEKIDEKVDEKVDEKTIDEDEKTTINENDTVTENDPINDSSDDLFNKMQNDQLMKSSMTLLTEKQSSRIPINNQLLQCLPTVGPIVSAMLSEGGISIRSLHISEHEIEYIAKLKYNTGAMLGIDKATKIYNSKKIFKETSKASMKCQINILATIPSISKTMAKNILERFKFADLIDNNYNFNDLVNTPRKNKVNAKMLGIKAAANICKFLNGKITDVEFIPKQKVKDDSKKNDSKNNDDKSTLDKSTLDKSTLDKSTPKEKPKRVYKTYKKKTTNVSQSKLVSHIIKV